MRIHRLTTLVLFYSVFVVTSFSDTLFYWAADTSSYCNRADVAMCSGLCGSLHFNQHDRWPFVSNRQHGFYSWENSYSFTHVWCMEGTVASLMLYYCWPERTRMNGLFDTADIKSIDHTWRYSDIKSSDWRYCLPAQVNLSSYPAGSQLTKLSHEVGRLFYAAHIGMNHDTAGYHNYPPAFGWDAGGMKVHSSRFMHVLKNRFGFVNAKLLNVGQSGYEASIDTVAKYIALQQPVYAYVSSGSGQHAWLSYAIQNESYFEHSLPVD